MLVYLLKSGACLGILFLFYTLFLEKENMHVFKRFYLLAALAIALLIPALVFIEYVEVPAPTYTNVQPVAITNELINVPSALETDVLDIEPILWGIYFIGLLFFGIKFFKNLFQIFKRIRKNPKNRLARFTHVLLTEKLPPHTFFRYIFLNKKRLEANEIPKEVLLHEETHAQQKHSWDVVFVEFLQVIFWVNPFIYLSKKAIKLNHEFLADQAVLKNDIDETTYQNTLLSYLSPDSEKKYQPTMANLITNSSYSSIKKRFKVMKKHTTRKSVFIKSLLLVPLLALLLFGFSETKIETITTPALTENNYATGNEKIEDSILELRITEKGELFIEGREVSLVVAEIHVKELIKQDRIIRAFILPDFDAPNQIILDVNKMLAQYQLAQIDIIGPEKLYSIQSSQKGATKTQLARFNSLAKKYNKQPKATRTIPLKDLKTLESVFRKMTDEQRKNAEPFPECAPKDDQEGATKDQIKEYNTLAKKYNRQLSKEKSITIYKKDVERLEYLYGLMTHEQRENAESFPDFPEPPPPPNTPKAPKVKKGEKSDIPLPPEPPAPSSPQDLGEKEFAENKIQEIIANQDPHDFNNTIPIASFYPTSSIFNYRGSEELQSNSALQKINERQKIQEHFYSPNPPSPKSPLDHVIELAKKDAIFYYEGKEISSDKAISILKENKDINIDSRSSKGKRPVVKLSTEPITIDN